MKPVLRAALAALEGPLPGVDEDVPPQVVAAPESGATVMADVRFLTRGEQGAFPVSHQRRFGRCAQLPLGFDSLRFFWLWPLHILDARVWLWLLGATGVLGPAAAQQHVAGVRVRRVQDAQVLDDAVASPVPAARSSAPANRPPEPWCRGAPGGSSGSAGLSCLMLTGDCRKPPGVLCAGKAARGAAGSFLKVPSEVGARVGGVSAAVPAGGAKLATGASRWLNLSIPGGKLGSISGRCRRRRRPGTRCRLSCPRSRPGGPAATASGS